eukprot:51993_1
MSTKLNSGFRMQIICILIFFIIMVLIYLSINDGIHLTNYNTELATIQHSFHYTCTSFINECNKLHISNNNSIDCDYILNELHVHSNLYSQLFLNSFRREFMMNSICKSQSQKERILTLLLNIYMNDKRIIFFHNHISKSLGSTMHATISKRINYKRTVKHRLDHIFENEYKNKDREYFMNCSLLFHWSSKKYNYKWIDTECPLQNNMKLCPQFINSIILRE